MDKLGMLRRIDRTEIYEQLEPDEIRLYILLLANSKGRKDEEIDVKTVMNAFGKAFSVDRLKTICQKLSKRGLIEAFLDSKEKAKTGYFVLTYRILPYMCIDKNKQEKR